MKCTFVIFSIRSLIYSGVFYQNIDWNARFFKRVVLMFILILNCPNPSGDYQYFEVSTDDSRLTQGIFVG